MKKTQQSQPRLRPIKSNNFWTRIQIDLVDMRHNPCEEFKWIAHVEDHFSKFHVIWAMKNKCAEEVAQCLKERVFAYFGLPQIFQSDNGLEFRKSFH